MSPRSLAALPRILPVSRVYVPRPHRLQNLTSLHFHTRSVHLRQASTYPAPRHIRKSAVNWTSVAICLAVGATVGFTVGLYNALSASAHPAQVGGELFVDIVHDDEMTVQLPRGRPGTLTQEEEAKLRELWHLILNVSGVSVPVPQTPNGKTSQSPALSRTTSASSSPADKKKKSRLSFLKRKKDHAEEKEVHDPARSSTASQTTPGSVQGITDGMKEDKHGTAAAFKAALAEATPAEIHEAFWSMVKHDHPDALLLRFLRARKWDVNAALVMTISALHWRLAEFHVDSDIMPNGEAGMLEWAKTEDGQKAKEGEDFMSQIRMGKSFLHGKDKEGRPICYVRVRLHKPGQECEESIERFTVHTIETARMFLRPPVDTATVLFDMTDFGMANMDYAPIKFMIKCFEANYPESLGVVLVHNAPWIFNTVWKIIKGWLDPVVASKIHFTNNLKDVQEFIDESSIIKELGGPVDWDYEYIEPRPDENATMKDVAAKEKLQHERSDLAREYEHIIQDWISASPAGPAPTPAVEADALRKRRDETAAKLRKNYWQLDPYVRARSLYDRLGDLQSEDADGLSKQMTNVTLNVPKSGENSGRPSVDSVAQSFYTTRETWEDDLD